MLPPKQPKITQKLIVRSAIALFALAGLLYAFLWYKGREADPTGYVVSDTNGMIAAVQATAAGRHVVAIKPDGTVISQSGVPPNSEDRDPTWRPDGNAIF